MKENQIDDMAKNEVRYFYFHRDLDKIQKDVDVDYVYPHGHFGVVCAAAELDRETSTLKVGFGFVRAKYPWNKETRKFIRNVALGRANSSKGNAVKFEGNSRVHVIKIFNNELDGMSKAGFARKMCLS